jgi:acetyltransferase-like isoleucine patch superfamily enzyme
MKKVFVLLTLLLPWGVRRRLLVALMKYDIHPTARIGFSWISPESLEMGPGAQIGSLTLCKGLSLLKMGEHARIGNLNWISAFPKASNAFFGEETDRRAELIVGDHAAITHRHLIDCTNSVRIGRFSTFAGYRSQMLTHSIDLWRCRQASKPITIGDYCFVGTNSVLLGGSSLPDYSVLGANSVLNTAFFGTHQLYAGNPARAVQELTDEMLYFQRSTGVVN